MTSNRYAAAISEHPVAAHAVGEIAGSILETLAGQPVDVLLVFVSPHFAGAADEIAGVFRAVLAPGVVMGAAHSAVVGTGREVETGPAIAAWAASFDRTSVQPIALDVVAGEHGTDLVGFPTDTDAHTLVLLADPFSFPAEGVLDALGHAHPALRVVGGMASAANGPGGSALLLGEHVRDRGAVGVLLDGADPVDTVVSQGCRPVGRPFTVTAVDGNHVVGLGGRPALDRLQDLLAEVDEVEREQLVRGLHVGLVTDEQREEFGRGDFLVRNVLGARQDDGAVAVGAAVALGQTLQFQVRDASAADADLRSLLAGRSAAAALLFTCTGRGRRLFGAPDHDARVVADLLGAVPLAGGFCAGELGPVGGRNHVHGFTASLALFS